MFYYILFALALTIDLNVISPVLKSCMQCVIKSSAGMFSIFLTRIITHVSKITSDDKSVSSGVIIIQEGSVKNIIHALRCVHPSSLWSAVIVLPKSDNVFTCIIHDLIGVKFISNTHTQSISPQNVAVITCVDDIHWKDQVYKTYSNATFYSIFNGEPITFVNQNN